MAKEYAVIDGLRSLEQNLHEFQAEEDTMFLDIIFPDYDEDRDCLFFKEHQHLGGDLYKLCQTDTENNLILI